MRTDYAKRTRVEPPFMSLAAVRTVLGLKQSDICREVSEILGHPFTAGALSAIENGHRGVSAETLEALEIAIGARAGDLQLRYEPSHSRRKAS